MERRNKEEGKRSPISFIYPPCSPHLPSLPAQTTSFHRLFSLQLFTSGTTQGQKIDASVQLSIMMM